MRTDLSPGRVVRGAVGLAALAGCPSDQSLFEQQNTDSWAQAPTDQVDILFVIDDSNTMVEEQDTLAHGFASFASRLEDSATDFQLGVITTSFLYDDPTRGHLIGDPPILRPTDDYEAAFTSRAIVGLGGSDKEKGFEAAAHALHPSMTIDGAPNAGFVRKDAALLVVFVSDEDDCSDGGALEGQPATACYGPSAPLVPVHEYVGKLHGLKRDPSLVSIGAIVAPEDAGCPAVFFGQRYIVGALLTGGLVMDICEPDWSSMLGELGLNATGIRTTFQTTDAAKADTLVVKVDEQDVAPDPVDGWTYDDDTWFLEFHGAGIPERGSTITASYTVKPGVPSPPAEGAATD